MFYNATADTELVNAEPLLPDEIEDWVPESLWSHSHH